MKNDYPLTDEQRILVKDNLTLVSYALSKVPVYLFDSRDDAFQIGAIGLIKAARTFDPSRNILFTTYASRCIINELLMSLRHISRTQPHNIISSYDAPIVFPDGETAALIEVIPSNDPAPDEQLIARDSVHSILLALQSLPDREALRIMCMALHKVRQADMAASLGCTQSAISRRLQRIRTALSRSLT